MIFVTNKLVRTESRMYGVSVMEEIFFLQGNMNYIYLLGDSLFDSGRRARFNLSASMTILSDTSLNSHYDQYRHI